MAKIQFKERQRYQNWSILIAAGLVAVVAIIRGVLFLTSSQQSLTNALISFAIALLFIGLFWLLTSLQLNVAITKKKIKFKLHPLHTTKRSIHWKEVEACQIVNTSEVAQWSGDNISFNHEKMFSLSGRNGLSITTKKGENYFIGCKNTKELQKVLKQVV